MEDLAALPSALLEVKPTMLYSVPTLFKRVYDKIQEKARIHIYVYISVGERMWPLSKSSQLSPSPALSLPFPGPRHKLT